MGETLSSYCLFFIPPRQKRVLWLSQSMSNESIFFLTRLQRQAGSPRLQGTLKRVSGVRQCGPPRTVRAWADEMGVLLLWIQWMSSPSRNGCLKQACVCVRLNIPGRCVLNVLYIQHCIESKPGTYMHSIKRHHHFFLRCLKIFLGL